MHMVEEVAQSADNYKEQLAITMLAKAKIEQGHKSAMSAIAEIEKKLSQQIGKPTRCSI